MDWRIFVIGPMESQAGSGGSSSAGPENHLAWIRAAVAGELQRQGFSRRDDQDYRLSGGGTVDSSVLEKDDDRIFLITPVELYGPGDIPTNVFDAIDECDLVVADLSGQRPAVVYEVAFAHALGIRTILVREGEEDTFYLRQIRTATLDFAGNAEQVSDLSPYLREWLLTRDKRFNSPNPMTSFYGAPLPDISAAAGLATGYFDSFLRPVLAPSAVIVRPGAPDAPVRGVLVLKPSDFSVRIQQLAEELGAALTAADPPLPLARGMGPGAAVGVRTDSGPRPPFYVAAGWVIDVPRTVLTLEMSRRMVRGSSAAAAGPGNPMAGALIERFFETTKALLLAHRVDLGRGRSRFFYGSGAELVRYAQTDGDSSSVWG